MVNHIITGNEHVYDVVTDDSTIEQDVQFFIQHYQRKIERLESLLKGAVDEHQYSTVLWNDTCAKTNFKLRKK